jgi:hypothetical protein
LKSLCQTTRTGSLTTSLTPSLNPKMNRTKFMRHPKPGIRLFLFYIWFQHFYLFIFTFFFTFDFQNQCRQLAHVLHSNPRFFCRNISIFRCLLVKNPPRKKKRTFTTRLP